MHAMRFSKRIGGDFGKPDGLDLSLSHDVGHGPDAVFDRNPLVPAVEVIEIDHIGLQALEAVLAGLCQNLRPAVDLAQSLRVAEHAAFAREDVVATAMLERIADEGF